MAQDNKPKLQFTADGKVIKLDNETNEQDVIREGDKEGKQGDSPNKPIPSNELESNVVKNFTAGPSFDSNKDPLTNLTNEEKVSTTLRTLPDGSVGLVSPVEKLDGTSIVDKQKLNPFVDAEDGETPQQHKVRLLQKIHTILKIGGMDTQQQQKSLVQLSELLFDNNDVLDTAKKFPETGNEPVGSLPTTKKSDEPVGAKK